jgi:hypothetical protein
MANFVPIALQFSEEQKQIIGKIAASVAPLLGSCDCVLLTLILRKDGAESAKDRAPEAVDNSENAHPAEQETFTVAEAATFLNVNRATIYRWSYCFLTYNRESFTSATGVFCPKLRSTHHDGEGDLRVGGSAGLTLEVIHFQ